MRCAGRRRPEHGRVSGRDLALVSRSRFAARHDIGMTSQQQAHPPGRMSEHISISLHPPSSSSPPQHRSIALLHPASRSPTRIRSMTKPGQPRFHKEPVKTIHPSKTLRDHCALPCPRRLPTITQPNRGILPNTCRVSSFWRRNNFS